MLGNKKPKGTVALKKVWHFFFVKKEMLHERERNWPFRDERGATDQLNISS